MCQSHHGKVLSHCFFFSTFLCVCVVLLLGIFLYTRWRSYKGLKEGVYHVSAHHDGWEDIRENVLNYDEEGGGEEDQVNDFSLTA